MPETDPKPRLLNLPNVLTLLRIALVGVFLWLFRAGRLYPSLAVFALASLTDALDGTLARKRGEITWLGKLLDPLADKLLVCAALYALARKGWAPWWLIAMVAGKELLMLLGGLVLLARGVVAQAVPIGKAATALFLIAIAATFFHPYTQPFDLYLQCLAFAAAMAALAWYAVLAVRALRQPSPARKTSAPRAESFSARRS